jgi:hypothetical protein
MSTFDRLMACMGFVRIGQYGLALTPRGIVSTRPQTYDQLVGWIDGPVESIDDPNQPFDEAAEWEKAIARARQALAQEPVAHALPPVLEAPGVSMQPTAAMLGNVDCEGVMEGEATRVASHEEIERAAAEARATRGVARTIPRDLLRQARTTSPSQLLDASERCARRADPAPGVGSLWDEEPTKVETVQGQGRTQVFIPRYDHSGRVVGTRPAAVATRSGRIARQP